MNWKDRKKKKHQNKKSKPIKARKSPRRDEWPCDSPFRTPCLLSMSAPAIEACGSLSKALEVGFIRMSDQERATLRRLLPVSRGGRLSHPDAEKEWLIVVDKAAKERNIDMAMMRKVAKNFEQQ